MMTWLHNWFWIQQDYLWFLAGIGWLAVGTLWWQGRRTGDMPAWAPTLASAANCARSTSVTRSRTRPLRRSERA